MAKTKHPSYKKMIIRTMKFLTDEDIKINIYSTELIRKSMIDFFALTTNEKLIKKFTKKAFNTLVKELTLTKNKNSYRFTSSYLKSKCKKVRKRIRVKKPEEKKK